MTAVYYVIRDMRHEDIPEVMHVDREVFPNDWTYRSQLAFQRDLENPSIRYIVACTVGKSLSSSREAKSRTNWVKRLFNYCWDDHTKDAIVGFSGFWMMLREAHIIAIGVRHAHRRHGLGEALLLATIELAASLNAGVITLEVRASNEAAQALYKKCGFHVVGKRLRYYSNNNEDGIIMSTDDIHSLTFQAHFQQLKRTHAEKHHNIICLVP
jgi:ribosomal-protein-alanine N-acetyltransferase